MAINSNNNYTSRITPENINHVQFLKSPNNIFVFGSNEAGRHGAGAARYAMNHFGAKYGIGIGLVGKSFAIPTKDHNVKTLPISAIAKHITTFINCAKIDPNNIYYVTKIGCGLAGLTPSEIAPLFKDAINVNNIMLPIEFWNILIPGGVL